jgi:hypothetical protein
LITPRHAYGHFFAADAAQIYRRASCRHSAAGRLPLSSFCFAFSITPPSITAAFAPPLYDMTYAFQAIEMIR